MIKFRKIKTGNNECTIDLATLYTKDELKKFDGRWEEFYASDDANPAVMERKKNTISYIHKSWVPSKRDARPSVFMLSGNPAPHSVRDDVYYSYEGSGTEHRFWKVFRELQYINMDLNPQTVKQAFFDLNYESPFRLGFEVIYTFPSTPSKPKWSGVAGVERLFGRQVMKQMSATERDRVLPMIRKFVKDGGAVIALQKDAYNAVAHDTYAVKRAVNFELVSNLDKDTKVYGTPPTRWLYTRKMKSLLSKIREDILCNLNI
jgi:hypothetical protein